MAASKPSFLFPPEVAKNACPPPPPSILLSNLFDLPLLIYIFTK